ncbi:MAG: 16S rRNA (adenine(1518)-N(6)/adenine(1519)-N(6))-dimethyltransferase RsmA [Alphaproteobacteria bacterium]|nr:16S rRNA (adenine(1518)-N(6)/adenine(1519)-N(6))-dimethyltransferase RsmA [Alphaproteobacteria bacterium]MDE2336037.1 16S rRNA (adenine(1518)-N(6)/adenine(1519)-N(6))-dimethyltransferase RsmA [Alphaproteobacteria bacterium]
MGALPPLRDVIARHGLMAKKSLGQNFLLDLNLTAKIAGAAGDLAGKNVIEIGPGPGGLTRALLDTGAASVHAVEYDGRCVEALQEVVSAADGRLVLHAADALETDMAALCPAPRAVVANLPYNIATALLTGWLENIDAFESLTLMFQREVAERIAAKPRTKDYGRLSIVAQWRAKVEIKFDIPPSAFTPPPKVTSTVVRFTPKKRADAVPFKIMERVTAAAFGQRRKMLRQSLKQLGCDVEKLLAAADIPPTARAEEIDIAGFVRLAEAYMGQAS